MDHWTYTTEQSFAAIFLFGMFFLGIMCAFYLLAEWALKFFAPIEPERIEREFEGRLICGYASCGKCHVIYPCYIGEGDVFHCPRCGGTE